MHVVAIQSFDGPVDARASAIAEATGLSAYEAKARAKGPGPRVVVTFGDEAQAQRVALALEARQLAPIVVSTKDMTGADRIEVRSLRFDPEALQVESRDRRRHVVPMRDVALVLRGTRIARETREETTRGRQIAIGRAVMTGGLVLTKKTERTVTTTSEAREGFLHLVVPGSPDVVLFETALQYESLGAAMQASRTANFAYLAAELRARTPGAIWDERLLTRAGQVHVLSGMLDPERWADVAIAVLAASLVTRSPYRSPP
jgi:hypothetical protein